MADLSIALENLAQDIIDAIPAIILAIIILILGWVIGSIVGKAVSRLVRRIGIEGTYDQSTVGRALKSSGLDFSGLVGGTVKAFIIILAIILAIQILAVGGTIGDYLAQIADYLPRLLAGILILILGSVFVDFLVSFIGNIIRPMFPEGKEEIADMLKNLLFIGLIAFIIFLALDTLLLTGDLIYPLILGFVIIAAGILLTDSMIKSIMEDHAEFRDIAGYAKFVLYSIFLIVGAGAIFATFPGVTSIIANISWAFAVALVIILVPVAYTMAKKVVKT